MSFAVTKTECSQRSGAAPGHVRPRLNCHSHVRIGPDAKGDARRVVHTRGRIHGGGHELPDRCATGKAVAQVHRSTGEERRDMSADADDGSASRDQPSSVRPSNSVRTALLATALLRDLAGDSLAERQRGCLVDPGWPLGAVTAHLLDAVDAQDPTPPAARIRGRFVLSLALGPSTQSSVTVGRLAADVKGHPARAGRQRPTLLRARRSIRGPVLEAAGHAHPSTATKAAPDLSPSRSLLASPCASPENGASSFTCTESDASDAS